MRSRRGRSACNVFPRVACGFLSSSLGRRRSVGVTIWRGSSPGRLLLGYLIWRPLSSESESESSSLSVLAAAYGLTLKWSPGMLACLCRLRSTCWVRAEVVGGWYGSSACSRMLRSIAASRLMTGGRGILGGELWCCVR